VVTTFEFRLHPVGPIMFFCVPFYPIEQADRLLPAWREFMATAPKDLSSIFVFWSVPAAPLFPEEMHGRATTIMVSLYSGPVEEGEPDTLAFRQDRPT
jgi:hypothetical protein